MTLSLKATMAQCRVNCIVCLLGALVGGSLIGSPSSAQIFLTPTPDGPEGNVVCVNGNTGGLAVSDSSTECGADNFGEGAQPNEMTFQDSSLSFVGNSSFTFNGTMMDVSGTANFTSNVNMSGTQTISGTTNFTGTTQIGGPSLTVNANATFNSPTDFTATIATSGISNNGSISTGGLKATSGLTAASGANVNMGGNQVHGVATGTANTDAVNVGQLNAVTGNVTQLQTTVATQTTQIAAIQTLDTTQSSQISALQSAESVLGGQIDTLFDLTTRDRQEARRGTAVAVAMSEAPMPSRDGGVSYSLHGSIYRGEYALGGSLKYRINAAAAVDVGVSYAGHSDTAARVGVSGEF